MDNNQADPSGSLLPTFLPIFGGLFCSFLSLGAVIPVLPGYVLGPLDAGELVVGIAITATALTAVVTRPLAGSLADRHGYRLIMLTGALLVATGGFLYLLPLTVPGLVGVRLLLGIGEGTVFTAGAAWTISLAPADRRGQLIGLYGVSMWGGITLGAAIGASLLGWGDYPAVWLFAALVPLIGALLVFCKREAHRPVATGRHRILPRTVLLPGSCLALASAGYAALAAFVVLHLQARGIAGGVAVFTAYGATYAGTRLVLGHLPDKYGPRRVALWAGLGEVLGLVIITLATNLPMAIIGGLIMGTGFSLLYPSLALMVINSTDSGRQGAALGAYTSFWDIGLGIWGPTVGAVASGWGYSAVFVVGAAAAATAVLLAVSTPKTGRLGGPIAD